METSEIFTITTSKEHVDTVKELFKTVNSALNRTRWDFFLLQILKMDALKYTANTQNLDTVFCIEVFL